MKIQVLKCDIEKANKLRKEQGIDFTPQCSCPIAQAVRRSKRKSVQVDEEELCVAGREYNLPEAAQKFIHSWDITGKARPLSFEATPWSADEL